MVCSLIPLALYALKSLGGGDLKLLVVLGACLGPTLGFEAQVYAFALASVYGFGCAAYDGALLQTLKASALLVTHPVTPRAFRSPLAPAAQRSLRLAPFMCLGVLLATAAHVVAP